MRHHDNPFTVTDEEAVAATERLLATVPTSSARYSVHIVESLDPAATAALAVTATVFGETFGNGSELLEEEYRSYLPSMLHIVACDTQERRPVGTLGLIRGPVESLKTVVDLAEGPWAHDVGATLAALDLPSGDRTAWDIATVAILPEHRRSMVVIAMFHTMFLLAKANGVRTWLAILDDPVLRGINLITGDMFSAIGTTTSAPYLGSAGSTAVAGRVPQIGDVLPIAALTTGEGLRDRYALGPEIEAVATTVGVAPPARTTAPFPTVDLRTLGSPQAPSGMGARSKTTVR